MRKNLSAHVDGGDAVTYLCTCTSKASLLQQRYQEVDITQITTFFSKSFLSSVQIIYCCLTNSPNLVAEKTFFFFFAYFVG